MPYLGHIQFHYCLFLLDYFKKTLKFSNSLTTHPFYENYGKKLYFLVFLFLKEETKYMVVHLLSQQIVFTLKHSNFKYFQVNIHFPIYTTL